LKKLFFYNLIIRLNYWPYFATSRFPFFFDIPLSFPAQPDPSARCQYHTESERNKRANVRKYCSCVKWFFNILVLYQILAD